MRSKRLYFAAVLLLAALLLSACKSSKTSVDKLRDLEFTVVEDVDLPEELKSIIDEKKAEPFKLSYGNEAYLYVVMGYGEQKTGGYSIQVDELYETDNAIYINTTLLGPSKDETVTNTPSCPYVVVKTEFIDKSVVFD